MLAERLAMPPVFQRGLRFVPPAIFAAIVFPEIFVQEGQIAMLPFNPRLIAGLIAGAVAWRSRNVLLTILVGMACLLIIQEFLG